DRDTEYSLSRLLQKGTMVEYQNEFEMLIKLLRARPTTLGEAFSLARLIEARFEAIAEKVKEQIIKKKADTILSLQSELTSPEVKESLDADEDIGVDEVISTIDGVLDSGKSNVKSMEECVIRVLDDRDVSSEKSREVFSITPWVAKGERRVLCYVQGSRMRKRKKVLAAAVEDGIALF
nr:class II heat shock protein [Tanacetum cinerariifolium]